MRSAEYKIVSITLGEVMLFYLLISDMLIDRVSVPYYNIPFLRNQRFVGRSPKLEVLKEKLLISKLC